MEWPSRSADLNPIENVFNEMMRGRESFFPRNRKSFEQYIIQRWEEMRGNASYFQILYASMPDRLQQVLDNNGGLIAH